MSGGLAGHSAAIVRAAARRCGVGASEQARLEAAWAHRAHGLEEQVAPVCRATKVNVETKGPAGHDPAWLIASAVRGEAAHEIATRGAVAMHRAGVPVDGAARTALDNAGRAASARWMHARAPEDDWVETVSQIARVLDGAAMEPLALERVDALRALRRAEWDAMRSWPHWVRALGIAHARPRALATSGAEAGADALEEIAHACGIAGMDGITVRRSLAAWPFEWAVPAVLTIALCAREGLEPITGESAWGGALRAEREHLALAGARDTAAAARALRGSLDGERERVQRALKRHGARGRGQGAAAHPVLYASRTCGPGWRIEHDRPVHIAAVEAITGGIPERGRERARATLVRLELDGTLVAQDTVWTGE